MISNLFINKKISTTFKVASVLVSLGLVGCNSSMPGTTSNTTVTQAPTVPPVVTPTVTADLCTAPVTKVIDFGERTTTGATMGVRGAFSDIAQMPTTSYPAYVFTDAGSLTLKYQYWDGSKYNMEIIDGGLTYNFVRLVYLSTGKPLVFWTNGASAVYMASRNSASHSAASAWTIGVIDSNGALARAVEASVSPNDRVGVFYINATGTAARTVLCDSNCDTAANYTGFGTSTNSIAASATASATANSADIKWCNAGSGDYYPIVTYPGTANTLIARCASAVPGFCSVHTNWTTATVTDGTNNTGANQITAKLYVGPNAGDKFSVVGRRNSLDIRAFTQNSGDCATGALTFNTTSGVVASGATIGNAYINLEGDSSGTRWHVVANTATTALGYYNSTSGTINSAWNSIKTIETTTLAAAGSTRGGLVVDQNSDQILLTYGRTASGTPTQTIGNVVLAFNQCPTGGIGCLASTLASPSSATDMSFGNAPLDATGQIQLATAQLPNVISLATTSTGKPAVAFIDFSVGSATTGRLKYKLRSGTSASDVWLLSDVGTAVSPQAVSLAFDHLDRPWIAYYDGASLRYFLVTNSQNDGSGVWTQYQFPIANAAAATLPAVNNVALAMSTASSVRKPLMIVSNSGAATKVIRAALFDPATETWSNNSQLDTGVANFSKLSADYDSSGNIALAYFDTTNSTIKMTATSNAGSTWLTTAAVISGAGGQGLDLKLNPSNNRPAIAFYDRANNLVRYKYCNTALATCTTSTNWVNLGTGVVEGSAGVSTLSAAATDGLLNASLTFTNEGYPWVTYSMGSASVTGHLVYSSTSATSTLFGLSSILNSAQNSITATPVAATPANFGLGGWNPTSVRSSVTGSVHTAYVGPGNYLYVTSCGN